MLLSAFLALALTSSPMPAENYGSWIAPEIADEITTCSINEEYREYLDFNGDGNLNIADAVGVQRRYQDNITYGNELTLDAETVYAIAVENYSEELIYWEIDRIDGELTRQYELTVSEITQAEIYLEFEEYSECVKVEDNPFTETISIIAEEAESYDENMV